MINSSQLMCAIAFTIALSGCNKPLDFRNAEIAHGKIYAAGADSGFSGKVTNIPFDKLPAELVYKFSTVISKTLTNAFHAYSPVYGGARGAFCDTSASNGIVDGETTCRMAESGFTVFKFSFKNGRLDGALVVYELKKDGAKAGVANFTKGDLEGASEIISDGKVIETQTWSNGALMQTSQSSAATEEEPTIKTLGRTADGKYPIYELEGELNDLNYASPGVIWNPNDLLTRLEYLDPADVDAGYSCDWVCKDSANHIVGLNPGRKISPN